MNARKIDYIVFGLWCVGLLFVCVLAYWPRGGNVSDKSNGVDAVRDEFKQAGEHQQAAAERIEAAEKHAQSSQIRLGRAAECTLNLQVGADESSKLIGECQQIIAQIRARGKVEIKKD